MTHADAFIASILAHPEDDLPRLVYADWLEENGDHERSEFIRVQCEICRLMMWRLPHNGGTSTGRDLAAERRASLKTLRKRERELWSTVWLHVAAGLPGTHLCGSDLGTPTVIHALAEEWQYPVRRGFVDGVTLPLASFMGGTCEACDGRGLPLRMIHPPPRRGDWPDCPTCAGTGRTEGIAKRLFESQPVMRVEFTDREPEESAQYPGWFRWWSWADPDNAAVIGYDLYKRLRSDFSISDYQPYFSTPDLAIAALSDAAVDLGRSLAGLPALIRSY